MFVCFVLFNDLSKQKIVIYARERLGEWGYNFCLMGFGCLEIYGRCENPECIENKKRQNKKQKQKKRNKLFLLVVDIHNFFKNKYYLCNLLFASMPLLL